MNEEIVLQPDANTPRRVATIPAEDREQELYRAMTGFHFWRAVRENFRNAIVAFVAGAGLTYALLTFDVGKKVWLTSVLSAALGISASVFVALILDARAKTGEARDVLDDMSRKAHRAELAAGRATSRLETAMIELETAKSYLGIEQVPDLPRDGEEGQFLSALQASSIEAAEKLSRLVATGSVTATYKDQLDFAGIFASTAQERFWATSCDRPSAFALSSHHYLEGQEQMKLTEVASTPGEVPRRARIFLGSVEDLLVDLTGFYDKLLDLHEWHARWGRAGGEASAPLRFFVYSQTGALDEMFDGLVMLDDRIDDFMIVDDRVVYGRKRGASSGQVVLAYLYGSTTAAAYKQIFSRIWAASRALEDLLDRLLLEIPIGSSSRREVLEDLKKQVAKRESKLKIEEDYHDLFPTVMSRSGADFYQHVCSLIARATRDCIAVDRAQRKGGELWEAWEQEAYKGFEEASFEAALSTATSFSRLFLLDRWPERRQREKVREFLAASLAGGVKVGFLLTSESEIGEVSERYDTDFLIVGLGEVAETGAADSFGFELQDENFDYRDLDWQKNLIARSELSRFQELFLSLWQTDSAILVESIGEVDQAVDELIRRGGTNA